MEDVVVSNVVTLVKGVGSEPLKYVYIEGDTVKSILERANIELANGMTVSLGRRRVEDFGSTEVKPGDLLVITKKICNG